MSSSSSVTSPFAKRAALSRIYVYPYFSVSRSYIHIHILSVIPSAVAQPPTKADFSGLSDTVGVARLRPIPRANTAITTNAEIISRFFITISIRILIKMSSKIFSGKRNPPWGGRFADILYCISILSYGILMSISSQILRGRSSSRRCNPPEDISTKMPY